MKEAPMVRMSLIKYFRRAIADPIGLRTEMFQQYGNISQMRLRGVDNFNFFHPECARQILGENQDAYLYKHPFLVTAFEPLAGRVSLVVDNDLDRWEHDRRTTLMSFDEKAHFEAYTCKLGELTANHIDYWTRTFRDKEHVDVESEINWLVADVVLNTLFHGLNLDSRESSVMISETASEMAKHMGSLNKLPWLLPTKRRRDYHSCIDGGNNLTKKVIQARLNGGRPYDDLLGNLIRYSRKTNAEEALTDLVHKINALIGVGYFTSAALLHYALVFLSQYPEVERKIANEVSEVLGDRALRFEDLEKLGYLHAFLKEVLRLNPTSFAIFRQARWDNEVMGFRIPKDAGAVLNVYHIHRHPDFWDNPEGFDPERFVAQPLGQDNPFAYIPFGSGKRSCVGRNFALLEVTVILTMLVRRLRFLLPPHVQVTRRFTTLLSMRPDVPTMQIRFKS